MWGSHAQTVLLADDVEPAPEHLWKAALKEHRQITDAIDKGDAERAAMLTRRHLVGSHAFMSLRRRRPHASSALHGAAQPLSPPVGAGRRPHGRATQTNHHGYDSRDDSRRRVGIGDGGRTA